ncbi:hypothetical protein FNJ47_36920 [Bradyrhizobium sp. UFLA 03-164]|uniref:Uncharacterized protein n=1 Tax=Bradyrhizobium uaiense TaxID=2594946 RepID=A0A6P1BUM0_9BRAD|nr:hypothetical protein [Bradyrhizobium uaiense]
MAVSGRSWPPLVGGLHPLAPMRRLDVERLAAGMADPFAAVPVAREHQRMNHAVIVEDADLELPVRRR